MKKENVIFIKLSQFVFLEILERKKEKSWSCALIQGKKSTLYHSYQPWKITIPTTKPAF